MVLALFVDVLHVVETGWGSFLAPILQWHLGHGTFWIRACNSEKKGSSWTAAYQITIYHTNVKDDNCNLLESNGLKVSQACPPVFKDQQRYGVVPMSPTIRELCSRASQRTGFTFNHAVVLYYADGNECNWTESMVYCDQWCSLTRWWLKNRWTSPRHELWHCYFVYSHIVWSILCSYHSFWSPQDKMLHTELCFRHWISQGQDPGFGRSGTHC